MTQDFSQTPKTVKLPREIWVWIVS